MKGEYKNENYISKFLNIDILQISHFFLQERLPLPLFLFSVCSWILTQQIM